MSQNLIKANLEARRVEKENAEKAKIQAQIEARKAKEAEEAAKKEEAKQKDYEEKILTIARKNGKDVATVKGVVDKINQGKLIPITVSASHKIYGLATSKADAEAGIQTLYWFREQPSDEIMKDEEVYGAMRRMMEATQIAQDVIDAGLVIDDVVIDADNREHWVVGKSLLNLEGEEESNIEDLKSELDPEDKKKILLERAEAKKAEEEKRREAERDDEDDELDDLDDDSSDYDEYEDDDEDYEDFDFDDDYEPDIEDDYEEDEEEDDAIYRVELESDNELDTIPLGVGSLKECELVANTARVMLALWQKDKEIKVKVARN